MSRWYFSSRVGHCSWRLLVVVSSRPCLLHLRLPAPADSSSLFHVPRFNMARHANGNLVDHLLNAASRGKDQEVRRLLNQGAPFGRDWVSRRVSCLLFYKLNPVSAVISSMLGSV